MSCRAHGAATGFLVCLLTAALVQAAPNLWTDALPWEALDGPSSFGAGFARMEDGDSDWRVDDLTLQHVGVRGETGRWFLRWRHLAFSTTGATALERWPALAGPDAEEGWPGERRVAGWGRPEIGLLDTVKLPLLGTTGFGLGAALPFASNTLYPFASRSTSLRLQLRRSLALGEHWRLFAEAGRVVHAGAAGEDLLEDAFQSRTLLGGALEWRAGDRYLQLGLSTLGEESERFEGRLGWPLSDDVGLVFEAVHELADASDRPYGTRLGLFLRIRGLTPDGGDGSAPPSEGPAGRPARDDN